MKPGKPLERRTPITSTVTLRRVPLAPGEPLSAGVGLTRTRGLVPGPGPTRHAPMSSRPSQGQRDRAEVWRQLREVVLERDGFRCVMCGSDGAGHLEVHHRRRKGMGGSTLLDHPANLLTLCGHGNVDGCHGWAHRHSVAAQVPGLIVPEGEDIAGWPVAYSREHGGGWYLLDDEGGRRRAA